MKKQIEKTTEITETEQKQFEEKAKELARKYGVSKVHVYAGIEPETNERIVGYLKEPSYLQKLMAMDKIHSVGVFMASNDLREAITIKEESHPLTYGEGFECDSYKLGMSTTCIPIIEIIQNSFKKK